MKLEDFMFTMGYQGGSAIVDKGAKKQFKKKSVSQLLEEGLYKPAFCKALYEDNQNDLELVLKAYNGLSIKQYSDINVLKKVFGVFRYQI